MGGVNERTNERTGGSVQRWVTGRVVRLKNPKLCQMLQWVDGSGDSRYMGMVNGQGIDERKS
jgi:type IV secretory pathway protease TraF